MGKSKKIIKSKKLDVDKVTELVSNNENFAGYCTLINYGENDFNKNDNQGIINNNKPKTFFNYNKNARLWYWANRQNSYKLCW